ncbi:MAG: threonine--tRNA ligase [Eubacteriales bacterium]|nr:threonine--tRNA ligase [Eubacteriales bacterium]
MKLKSNERIETIEAAQNFFDLREHLDADLYRGACLLRINGEKRDLRTSFGPDDVVEVLDFSDPDGAHAFFHSASHVLAQAVKRLMPEAKLAIGPAIDGGFYYDIDIDHSFSPEELKELEKMMKKIVKERQPIEYLERSREEALAWADAKEEPYKRELIEDLPEDATISFYRQGDFEDLCAGPHVLNTAAIKAFKLTHSSGAYWRGDSSRKMLQRIYGIAYPNKEMLTAELERRAEAEKRDHNKIGRELGYFTTVDIVGQGLPLFPPKGCKTLQLLQRFVEDEEERRGYQLTKTPLMAKSDLYKVSGHWDHYRDGMFVLGRVDENGESEDGDEVMALRPMTCPFQYQLYLQKTRSYRDLPIRYDETSTLFRNENSGEMHGLIRLRQFTISEAHIICRKDQVKDEFIGALDLARYMLRVTGLEEDVSFNFSTHDPANKEKYIGDESAWEEIESYTKNLLDELGLKYKIGVGDAAFYGPKLDLQIKNVFGKEDTLITIQIDMMLAEKFGMYYTDSDGKQAVPYIVHRTSIGCYERTLALLIEKYAGALPLWISAEQVRILPISDRFLEAADAAEDRLRRAGIRVSVDRRDEKIGKKIRVAQMEKVPYMLVLGEKEVESGGFAVRHRKQGDLGLMSEADLIARIKEEVESFYIDR